MFSLFLLFPLDTQQYLRVKSCVLYTFSIVKFMVWGLSIDQKSIDQVNQLKINKLINHLHFSRSPDFRRTDRRTDRQKQTAVRRWNKWVILLLLDWADSELSWNQKQKWWQKWHGKKQNQYKKKLPAMFTFLFSPFPFESNNQHCVILKQPGVTTLSKYSGHWKTLWRIFTRLKCESSQVKGIGFSWCQTKQHSAQCCLL